MPVYCFAFLAQQSAICHLPYPLIFGPAGWSVYSTCRSSFVFRGRAQNPPNSKPLRNETNLPVSVRSQFDCCDVSLERLSATTDHIIFLLWQLVNIIIYFDLRNQMEKPIDVDFTPRDFISECLGKKNAETLLQWLVDLYVLMCTSTNLYIYIYRGLHDTLSVRSFNIIGSCPSASVLDTVSFAKCLFSNPNVLRVLEVELFVQQSAIHIHTHVLHFLVH